MNSTKKRVSALTLIEMGKNYQEKTDIEHESATRTQDGNWNTGYNSYNKDY